MEAIGGFGANLAGQILAKAAVLGAGFYGVNFSSYGTEKRGTPVRSLIGSPKIIQKFSTIAPWNPPCHRDLP